MKLEANKEKLEEILKMFYRATGVGIGVYTAENEKIALYPDTNGPLCQIMRHYPHTRAQCERCDIEAFHRCKESKEIQIYICHAGLTEIFAPVVDSSTIIGYISFGQLASADDDSIMLRIIRDTCKRYNVPLSSVTEQRCLKEFVFKSYLQIVSMAGIMEVCAKYLTTEQIVKVSHDEYLTMIDQYIDANLTNKIVVEDLCKHFAMSRTKMFQVLRNSLPVSLTQYVLNKRIELAKKLLTTTNLSILEISEQTGFSNHNYFCTVFKKCTAQTPLAYQKSIRSSYI